MGNQQSSPPPSVEMAAAVSASERPTTQSTQHSPITDLFTETEPHENKPPNTAASNTITAGLNGNNTNNTDNTVCGICLNEVKSNEMSSIDCCQHKFCLTCIQQWAKRENTCPFDKKRFSVIEQSHPTKINDDDEAVNSFSVENRNQGSDAAPRHLTPAQMMRMLEMVHRLHEEQQEMVNRFHEEQQQNVDRNQHTNSVGGTETTTHRLTSAGNARQMFELLTRLHGAQSQGAGTLNTLPFREIRVSLSSVGDEDGVPETDNATNREEFGLAATFALDSGAEATVTIQPISAEEFASRTATAEMATFEADANDESDSPGEQ